MKRLLVCAALGVCLFPAFASDPPPPLIQSITASNNVKTVTFAPAPAIESYTIRSGTNVAGPLSNETAGVVSGTTYKVTNSAAMQFYKVAATPMSSNDLLSVNLLNRIAYGPTPDELTRVRTIGPQAYIAEQLAPETITESIDVYRTESTNNASSPNTAQWQFVTYQGVVSSSNMYVYLTQPGDVYIDDISLTILTNVVDTNTMTTNLVESPNLLVNGGFEDPLLLPEWLVTANTVNSSVTSNYAHSGQQSLRLVCAAAGSGDADSLRHRFQNFAFGFNASTQKCNLSFWYLAATNSDRIKIRLSGSGTSGSGNRPPPTPEWIYATATGTANNNHTIYIYTSGAGETYIDDLKLVSGTVPEVGPNLIRNGDFEAPLNTNNWNVTANFANSFISSNFSRSGSSSLKVVATAAGAGNGNSVFQTNIFVTNNQTYTVSFWYLEPTRGRTLTVRLSGANSGNTILSDTEPVSTSSALHYRLDRIHNASIDTGAETVNTVGGANLADLRAYHVLNAVSAKRQLIEVLLQFLENHFVTQHSKSVDYFDRYYDDGNLMDIFATDWEYRERVKWRNALLNPNCTFYDLLKIHAESPAEIVYLDSVDSRGNNNNVANENYAREVQELFCMGVDNGYEQQDIVVMSRAWTGWSVDIVDAENISNPFASQSQRVGFYPGNGTAGISNLIGVWTFNYKPANHGTNRAPIWSVWDTNSPATNPQPVKVGGVAVSKTYPARFGPPWAGQPYALTIPVNRSGTNGILDGYDIISALSTNAFTMEFISAKLCRLFVHEDFVHGVYDYTDPNRSAEAELVHQCMVAWNTPGADGRKGNIRSILNTIFNSDLFRSHGGSLQKVKTPLEFAVSAIRALRSNNSSGALTADTDGYSISGRSRTASSAPLTRMGSMMLFDRDAPDGYPEAGAAWISSGTLAERIRFIQTTLMTLADTNKNDGISQGNFNATDPVGLLKAKIPAASWNNAGAVADFFLGILYPGEGRANLDNYRTLAINFLNTSDDGLTSSLFSTLNNSNAAYDSRVRAMVAMLMTLPRFQEQ